MLDAGKTEEQSTLFPMEGGVLHFPREGLEWAWVVALINLRNELQWGGEVKSQATVLEEESIFRGHSCCKD